MIPRPVAINPALLDGLTTLAGAGAVDSLMRPFFAQHGRSSHGPRQRKGDLRGDTLVVDFDSPKIMGHREAMMNRMNPGDLPTENEPRPGDGEVATGTDWIDARRASLTQRRSLCGKPKDANARLSNVLVTMLQKMEVNAETFVDSLGPVSDII